MTIYRTIVRSVLERESTCTLRLGDLTLPYSVQLATQNSSDWTRLSILIASSSAV
jgi:hypothetical protein